jgi:predicted XRE-type DNA-binding protein
LQIAGSIEGQLRQAYAKCHEERGVTQSQIAEKVGIDRSAVHRRLSGRSNMTIETIADMVWALGHCMQVRIFDPSDASSNGHMIVPRGSGLADGAISAVSATTGRVVASPDQWQEVYQ